MGESSIESSNHARTIEAQNALGAAARMGKTAAYSGIGTALGTPGAIDPTQAIVYLAVDGTDGYTLANPPDTTNIGFKMTVVCLSGVNTPNATVTPASTAGPAYTAVSAFGVAGDFCEFIWAGAGWATGAMNGVTRA